MSQKILIVDDSELISKLHKGILHEAGYDCLIAENGSVAMEMLFMDKFDLIIADINMPRMNGYELVRRVRKTQGYEKTPVLMISTEQKKQDILQAMEAGANLYAVKPVGARELVESVQTLLKAS